jgi:L-threonylcarbamoyladenylate synthase
MTIQPPANVISATEAARRIRKGQVVAIPTETVYGMAGNALDIKAVQRIFDIKQRPTQDPLIVHLADASELNRVAAYIPPEAKTLAATFWPGALTMVLPKKPCIPDLVTVGLQTVAVRVPIHPVARDIIRQAGCPVAAPSANRFGTISPTCVDHVVAQFGDSLAGIVDGGTCTIGVESTILGFWDNQIWLLRPGGISTEQIEDTVGPITRYQKQGTDDVRAPGSMPRHYAPNTPLTLLAADDSMMQAPDTGRLVFGPDAPATDTTTENLSVTGDLNEAAHRLYAALRRLDAAGLKRIVAYRLPDTGLGVTINDRLQRAATRHTTEN